MLLCVMLVAEVISSANAPLESADAAYRALDYALASDQLVEALRVEGNDTHTLLRLYELQASVEAILGKSVNAEATFRKLLSLDPDHLLSADLSPRITSAFFAARGWLAARAPFAAAAELASADLAGVRVKSDPMALARSVRFHIHEPKADWRSQTEPLSAGTAAARLSSSDAVWWVEVLGEADAVLVLLGSPEQPLSPAVAIALGAPAVSPAQMGGYVALGCGLAALVAGAAFGIDSAAARADYDRAARDSSGRVVGLTQTQALELERRSVANARVANVLLVSGGVVAAGGGAMWLWSRRTQVKVVPAGAGVAAVLAW